jgi:hypothetical protein
MPLTYAHGRHEEATFHALQADVAVAVHHARDMCAALAAGALLGVYETLALFSQVKVVGAHTFLRSLYLKAWSSHTLVRLTLNACFKHLAPVT